MQRFAQFAVLAAIVLAVAAWVVAPGPSAERIVAPENAVSFASWNMEWFPSGWPEPRPAKDEAARIRRAAAALRARGVPDVLLVQEIRDEETCRAFGRALGEGAPQLAVCSDFWFSPTNRGLQQVAVFSRFPVLAAGSEDWVASDFVFPPRGFAWAILDVRGEKVAVFGVHLKSNYVPEGKDEARQAVLNRLKRELAARQLADRAAAIAATNGWNVGRILLAGDFNTALEDDRFAGEKTLRTLLDAGFRDAFEGIPESARPTLPASERYPAATFDHIFAKGFGEPLSRRVADAADISDHAPIYAAWTIPNPDRPDTP